MNYKHIVETINAHQLRNVLTFDHINDRTILTNDLATKQQGLYWFWTSYSNQELKDVVRPLNMTGEIDISILVEQRMGLDSICKLNSDQFRVVYNGIGGGASTSSFGLRERILQEIKGQESTGSISITNSSLNDFSKWRVTYVNFNDEEFLNDAGERIDYLQHAELFEMLWRLHYGWPILCRR